MLRNILFLIFTMCTIEAVEFRIKNNEVGDIWIGIQGNSGKATLENGGFILRSGKQTSLSAPNDWAGRFWARTWCDKTTKHCLTGDCGNKEKCGGAGGAPPATLAEINLKAYGGLDYYDISLVDGYNIGASISPVDGTGDGSKYSCKKAACTAPINNDCPDKLKLQNGSGVIGCKSACEAYNTDQYCCRGKHSTPDTCKANQWPVNYAEFFKSHCPDAYSYAYDDKKSTFTCKAEVYQIEFGG